MKNSADQGGCYPQRPKAEVDNTLRDLQHSSYPTKVESIIALLFIQTIRILHILRKPNSQPAQQAFPWGSGAKNYREALAPISRGQNTVPVPFLGFSLLSNPTETLAMQPTEFNNCFIIHLKHFPVLEGVSPFRSLFFRNITQPCPQVFLVNGSIICSGLHF